MKKILLCTTVLAGFASSAFATGVTTNGDAMQVSVAGSSKFEGGYINRDNKNKQRFSYSPNQKSTAFLTSNKVAVKAQGASDDVTYGAVVRLQTVADSADGMSDTGMDRSHLFVNTNAGAVQLGTNFSASKLLAVGPGDITSATGGVVNGDAPAYIDLPNNQYTSAFDSAVTFDTDLLANRLDSNGESYRKITYLSPEISGFQLGLSYAPDVQNNGADNFTQEESARYLGGPVAVKNIVSAALKVKHAFDDVNVQLSLTGDAGKVNNNPSTVSSKGIQFKDSQGNLLTDANGDTTFYLSESKYNTSTVTRNDLRSYAVGSVVEYQGFSAGLSYSSDGKSLAPKAKNYKASWWTAALGYKNGPMSTSLSYVNGRKGDKGYTAGDSTSGPSVSTKGVSLGADYAVVPGMTPFAEVTLYQVKPNKVYNATYNGTTVGTYTKYKTTVFILGARAKF